MDTKTIGIIAGVVVAIGLLAFSFKNSFMSGPAKPGASDAAAMKQKMQDAMNRGNAGGASNSGGQPGNASGPGGRPVIPP